ncbi:MAG: hypothetical protein KatS3mg105_1695 [Gemmatales bacterium]|nr:MAG: hypothetical protein KatS3mg105_1695 [Gemmatales bacterium]
MAEKVNCPTCRRELEIPQELLSRAVQCPECGTRFMAVAPGTILPGEPSPPPPGYETTAGPIRDPLAEQRAASMLILPAICLILMGVLGALMAAMFLVDCFLLTPQVREQALREAKISGEEKQQLRQIFESFFSPRAAVVYSFFAFCSLLAMIAGVSMLARRLRGLAVLGSFAVMLNPFCCLIVGPILGIWSLVVLNNPDVKAAFR